MNVPIIKFQCTDCAGWFARGDLQNVGESLFRCRDCWKRQSDYVKSIDSYQNPPEECPICHRKTADLIAQSPREPLHMFTHLVDGRFTMLCSPCHLVYTKKRKDLYGKTRFGWQQKLK